MAPAELYQSGRLIRTLHKPDDVHTDHLNGNLIEIKGRKEGFTQKFAQFDSEGYVESGKSFVLDSGIVVVSIP